MIAMRGAVSSMCNFVTASEDRRHNFIGGHMQPFVSVR